MQRGFGIREVGSLLLAALVIGVTLPVLEPFLSMGITATGGITAILLMAIPFALVLGLFISILKPRPEGF